jgi:galactoside O-acetyltransferase
LAANNGGALTIGHRVGLNTNVHVDAGDRGRIMIGSDVLIAQNCVLRSSNHRFTDLDVPINRQGHEPGVIVIEDDVWIGANVVILPGVHIEHGCVIGASSVIVSGRYRANSVVVGNPARVVRRRGTEQTPAEQTDGTPSERGR